MMGWKKGRREPTRTDLERQSEARPASSHSSPDPALSGEIRKVQYSQWIGPLPSPDALERFNQVIPGGAERIFQMAEEEGKHRRKMEGRWSLTEAFLRIGGLLFAGIIALTGISAGVFLIYYERPLGAVAPFLLAVGSLIAALRGEKVARKRQEEQLQLDVDA